MTSQTVEEELQRILTASGIESSPIDPSSMDFLRQLVQDRKQTKASTKYSPSDEQKQRNGKESNSTSAAAPAASLPSSSSGTNQDFGNTQQTTSLSNSDAAMILEQLKMQTNLILSLQDKIQVLTNKVNHLEGTGAASTHTRSTESERLQ